MRVGWGYDAHAFGGDPPTLLAGVVVDADRGVLATSDGDVVAHAVADALLGASALGDLGEWFPAAEGADSMVMLATVVDAVHEAGFEVSSLDVTVMAESIRVARHRRALTAALAGVTDAPIEAVSVKATTTDGLGFVGRDEGLAAVALAVLAPTEA